MPRRKPRILSRETAETVKSVSAEKHTPKELPPLPFSLGRTNRVQSTSDYKQPTRTEVDDLYDVISKECIKGYRFTDNYYGIPWIEKGDIEDKGGGLFVVRFRSPVEYAHNVYFGGMAKDVCEILHCNLHVWHETRREQYTEKIGLDYEEYAWVIQKGELEEPDDAMDDEIEEDPFYNEIEEIPDGWIGESTTEEVDARIEKAIEDFV